MKRTKGLIVALTALLVMVLGAGAVVAAQRGGPQYDVDAISEPLFDWAYAFDSENEAAMEDAFTEDARFVFYLAGSDEPLIFEGRDAVMDLFLGAIAAQTPEEQRRHVTTNVLVDQTDAKTATVTSYLTLLIANFPTESPELRATGVYTDTVVLENDGEWRIKERILRLDTPS